MSEWFRNFHKRYKISRELPQVWNFPEFGFGYIQIPKVATRSIRAALMATQGTAAGYTDFAEFENRYGHHVAKERIRNVTNNRPIFAFVRHPLSRLYSGYVDKILNAEREGRRNIFACHGIPFGIDFDGFVEKVCLLRDDQLDRHLRSQAWFLTDSRGVIPSFLGRLESFNEDWAQLRTLLPSLGPVEHLNTAAGDANYLAHYSASSLAQARQRFARDFELFSYT
jgi:dermatan 4-sulfotransferase 1